MVRSILAVAFVVLLAMSASAYDFLYSGDSAMTHDAGAFGVGVTALYSTWTSVYDKDGEEVDYPHDGEMTTMYFPVDVYYSVMDAFEVGIQPKFVNLKYTYDMEARGEDECSGSGIGDTWIKLKYMFMPDPMLTGRLGVKIATGTEPDAYGNDEDGDLATSDGQMDIDGAVLFAVPAGPGQLDGAVGYRYRMTHTDVDAGIVVRDETYDYTPGSEIHFYVAYTYFLNDMMNLSLAADGFFGSDDEYDYGDAADRDAETAEDSGRNAVYINPGFEYLMENGMTLGAGFHYILMGANVPTGWSLSAHLGWGA